MKLILIIICAILLLWATSAYMALHHFENLEQASNFGESFGAVSALFSSFALALALALYSMVLQQKQNRQFEKYSLAALDQQSKQIGVLQSNIEEQLQTSKVSAIAILISQEERTIENLEKWGKDLGNKKKYDNGINSARQRIEKYREDLRLFTKK